MMIDGTLLKKIMMKKLRWTEIFYCIWLEKRIDDQFMFTKNIIAKIANQKT